MKIFKTIWMMFCCGQRLAGFEEAESGVCSDCDSPPLSKPLKIHNSNTKYKIQNTNTKAVFVRSAIVILHRRQTCSSPNIGNTFQLTHREGVLTIIRRAELCRIEFGLGHKIETKICYFHLCVSTVCVILSVLL